MKIFHILLSFILMTTHTVIFDFIENATISSWNIQDDRVMGGISQGKFELTKQGHGRFYGNVTVESNGGFSSVQNNDLDIKVDLEHTIRLKVKGDGNTYQFRVQQSLNIRESYIKEFKTTGAWQTIEIKLGDMTPSFRGRKLNLPNFNHDAIKHIRFLIGTKKVDQKFELIIDSIELHDI